MNTRLIEEGISMHERWSSMAFSDEATCGRAEIVSFG